MTLGVGPIASSVTNRFGCRVSTVVGAVLAAIGFGVSAAAPNIAFLYASVGLCAGVGFGFIYLPAIVSVSVYFEKRRAFATGIAVCGSGFGTFILAPLVSWLNDSFGWRVSFVCLGAIALMCFVFGCLFRPLEATLTSASTATTSSGKEEDDDIEEADEEDQDDVHRAIEIKPNHVLLSNRQPDGTTLIMNAEEQNGNFKDVLPVSCN